ncbi:MAG: ribonuclease HII [Thermoplasmata archaeon]
MLGIDEAGRGSWIGPLVVGGFVLGRERERRLLDLGVADSKTLSPRRREEIFAALEDVGQRLTVTLTPKHLDPWVREGKLNELEARAFARLVRRARPTEVHVDACDPVAPRFGARVLTLSRHACTMDARHRADVDVPVVSAASIVAKVARDRAIARLERSIGEPIGSGYPSDPATQRFVRSFVGREGDGASWLRRSWAPTQRLMRERSARRLESFA